MTCENCERLQRRLDATCVGAGEIIDSLDKLMVELIRLMPTYKDKAKMSVVRDRLRRQADEAFGGP